MLRRDDSPGVSGEAVAKSLDGDLGQFSNQEDGSPRLVQAEEGSACFVARHCEVLGPGGSRHRPEMLYGLAAQENPSAASACGLAVALSSRNTDAGHVLVEATPIEECPEQLGAVAHAGVDCDSKGQE